MTFKKKILNVVLLICETVTREEEMWIRSMNEWKMNHIIYGTVNPTHTHTHAQLFQIKKVTMIMYGMQMESS